MRGVRSARPHAVQQLVSEGPTGASSLDELVGKLDQAAGDLADGSSRRSSIRASPTLCRARSPATSLIDGGNSYYIDDIRRAAELKTKGIHYVDVGTSGGVWGLERGYCQMIGGEQEVVKRLDPIFATLAPPIDSAPRIAGPRKARRHGRTWLSALRPERRRAISSKWCTTASSTASWRLMPRVLSILRDANIGKQQHEIDAETTPLRHPEEYQYDLR